MSYALKLSLWILRHNRHRLAHNVRGFRCIDCYARGGDRRDVATFLVAAAWNEEFLSFP